MRIQLAENIIDEHQRGLATGFFEHMGLRQLHRQRKGPLLTLAREGRRIAIIQKHRDVIPMRPKGRGA